MRERARGASTTGDDVLLLSDRAIPGSRANIDHIAIAPSGVWVVDPKCYRGEIVVRKRLFGAAKLIVAGRNRTNLVDNLERQVETVRSLVSDDVPVRGALCFVGGDLPLFGTPTVRDVPLLHRRSLCRELNRRGPLGPAERVRLYDLLADRLRPA